VHPSSREGWPNVLLESMACGTAVVVGDFKGVEDIVTRPEAGRILPEATPDCLAETIHELLTEPPARAETRRYAENFDWHDTTRGQIDLFESICCSNVESVRGRAGQRCRC
jgi:glycosyltransferase involved in cell wall biosynthesis